MLTDARDRCSRRVFQAEPSASIFAICVGLLLVACGRDGAAPVATTLNAHDSAGIQILEVPRGYIAALPEWRLADEPLATIGQADGEEPYLFSRLSAFRRFEDGRIAVVDLTSREIRVFDESGAFLRKMGGPGEGPGEFGTTPRIAVREDGGVTAYDSRHLRVTVFTREGDVSDIWQSDPDHCDSPVLEIRWGRPCTVEGVFADGTLVLDGREDPGPLAALAGSTYEDLDGIVALSTADGFTQIASFPIPAAIVVSGTRPGGREGTVRTTSPFLAPQPIVESGRDHVAILFPGRFEVWLLGRGGVMERIVRLDRPGVRLTEAQRATILGRRDEIFQAAGVVEVLPAATSLIFGDGDAFWVRDYRHSAVTPPEEPDRYTVFGPDGVPVARVSIPDQVGYGIGYAGIDRVIVATTDDLGVPRVLVFEIEKT